jgi:hypothetical protein
MAIITPLPFTRTGSLQSAILQILALLTTQAGVLNSTNAGASAAVTANTLVVNHGLASTPSVVVATPNINTGAFWITAIGSTSFTLNWVVLGSPTWYWTAKV